MEKIIKLLNLNNKGDTNIKWVLENCSETKEPEMNLIKARDTKIFKVNFG